MKYLIKLIDWLVYMILSTLIFIFVASFFKSIYINPTHLYIYSFAIVTAIYILNKTIKPCLVTIFMPIIGITAGLFYPFINLGIMYIADLILKNNFRIYNFWAGLFVAILLSLAGLLTKILIDSVKKKVMKNG